MTKQIFALVVTLGFVSNAFADDWRMRKYDLDGDGYVVADELKDCGCIVRPGFFAFLQIKTLMVNYLRKNLESHLSI